MAEGPLGFAIGLEALRGVAIELDALGVIKAQGLFLHQPLEPAVLIGAKEVQQADDPTHTAEFFQTEKGQALIERIARVGHDRQGPQEGPGVGIRGK